MSSPIFIHTYWSEVPEALTVYIILTGEVPCSQHCRQNGTLPKGNVCFSLYLTLTKLNLKNINDNKNLLLIFVWR